MYSKSKFFVATVTHATLTLSPQMLQGVVKRLYQQSQQHQIVILRIIITKHCKSMNYLSLHLPRANVFSSLGHHNKLVWTSQL